MVHPDPLEDESDSAATVPSAEDQQVTWTPAELAAKLGPFDPPDHFDHGDEFYPDVPRPYSRQFKRGSFALRRKGVAIVWAALGATFAIVAPLPIIQNMSLHILPLGYLGWIGGGMMLIALFILIRNSLWNDRFEFVKKGTPLVGRILSVDHYLTKTVNAETKQETVNAQYLCMVEYDDPETRAHEFHAVLSPEAWAIQNSKHYAASVVPGDYVTLVAMPGNIKETLRLYGFLGLDPERELLTYRGKPLQGTSPFKAILIASLVFAGLWLFVGLMYALTFCFPEDWDWGLALGFMSGGGILGGIFGWWMSRWESAKSQVNGKSLPLIIAFGICGILAGVTGLGLTNSLLDTSAPLYEPVTIISHWQKTHKGIFRDYEVEYQEKGKANSEKQGVSYQTLIRLGTSKLAVKELRNGRLGLRWIAGFHPIVWIPLPHNADELQKARAVAVDSGKFLRFQMHQFGSAVEPQDANDPPAIVEKKELQVIPVILLSDSSIAPIPEEMLEPALAELKSHGM